MPSSQDSRSLAITSLFPITFTHTELTETYRIFEEKELPVCIDRNVICQFCHLFILLKEL